MTDIQMVIFFVAGGALLIGSAEALVRGASRLAETLGVSPLVIGLTVVAFGTSSPEMAVSVVSSLVGQNDIAVGNAVGSNILNILLILGLSALITPLVVAQQLVRLDVPLMIAVSLLFWWLASDGSVSRAESAVLVVGIAAYTVFVLRMSRRETAEIRAEYAAEMAHRAPGRRRPLVDLALAAAGLAGLAAGSRLVVDAAVVLAQRLGISELVIGLTIIAAGTSLPEVVTSVVASLRGERDIAVGNVIGSNIFNILAVIGLAGLVAPGGLAVNAAVRHFDLPVMVATAVACLPIFMSGHRIARWEGALFLGYYVTYTAYLVLHATQHDALPAVHRVMVVFVLPLTAATLLVLAARGVRDGLRRR